MNHIYVSVHSISNAINYFRSNIYTSPEQLGLFFFFKSIGFNHIEYTSYPKVSSIDDETRKRYLNALYNLSSLFIYESEQGERRNCLFPFSIKTEVDKEYFNPGTPFKNMLSRIRDTIDNTLIDESKYLRKHDSNSDLFKFPRNYINLIKENFLNSKKISIEMFASWYMRFIPIECDLEWITNKGQETIEKFTRVCIKKTIDDLNITENEFDDFFYHDDSMIDYDNKKIEGTRLRTLIKFKSGSEPEVTKRHGGELDYMEANQIITKEQTDDLSRTDGNNMSDVKLEQLLKKTKQIVLYGPPGTSKTYATSKLISKYETKVIQFHPNLTYEQFIGGFSVDNDGKIVSKPGMFLEFCETARANPTIEYLFVIDEINRGNISKIFGEVILALDREYEVSLPISFIINGKEVNHFSIPQNVSIIGTMNSADRSIALVDYAIRRRFSFIKFYPNYELLNQISDTTQIAPIRIGNLLKSINNKLFQVMKNKDLLIGHSYFIPKWAMDSKNNVITWTPVLLMDIFNLYILPLVEEYTYGNERFLSNIFGDKLINRIDNPVEFIKELTVQFNIV